MYTRWTWHTTVRFYPIAVAHERLSSFEIRIGMNPTDFSENALCFNMTGIAPIGEISNYPCITTTRGRYLSIQRYPPYGANGKQLTLCEVQVFPPGEVSFIS